MEYIVCYDSKVSRYYVLEQDKYGNLYDTRRSFKTKQECYQFIKRIQDEAINTND